MRTLLQSFAIFSLLALSLVGCKQGEGDVCQITEDCEDGLECNAGTRRCQEPGTSSAADAAPPPVDASLPDAMPDAMP